MSRSVGSDPVFKDDLIDRLAEVLYNAEHAGEVPAWDQLDDDDAEEWEPEWEGE